jgi:hypothetical protein
MSQGDSTRQLTFPETKCSKVSLAMFTGVNTLSSLIISFAIFPHVEVFNSMKMPRQSQLQ